MKFDFGDRKIEKIVKPLLGDKFRVTVALDRICLKARTDEDMKQYEDYLSAFAYEAAKLNYPLTLRANLDGVQREVEFYENNRTKHLVTLPNEV